MHPAGAPTPAALILSLCATVAGFGVVSPLAHWALDPVALPAPFPAQNQHAESLAFVVTFAVLLPLAVLLVPRVLDGVAARHGGNVGADLSLSLGITLCALLAIAKVADGLWSASAMGMLFVCSCLWFAAAGAALVGLSRSHKPARALNRVEPVLWPALLASLAALILCFADLHSVALVPLAVGLAIAALTGYLVAYRPVRFKASPRALRWSADAAAIVLIALAVPNLVVFRPGDPSAVLETSIIQFHQDLWLGPANALVGGGTMLVDVLSQYGVGSIIFLGAVFKLIPIGNGTLALVEAAFSVAAFALAYVTLRLAGVGLALAWATLAIAVVVLVYNLVFPLGALLQHGAIRFGMPMVILAAAAGEGRSARAAPILRGLQIATVGLASLWAFEALLYSLGALAGLTAFRVAVAPAGRWRMVIRLVVQVIAACAVVQVTFALLTLAAAGQLPDWSGYLTTLREFLIGRVGDLTYDFSPWSPGLAVGALYAASTLALALVIRREPEFVAANRPALLVLSGTTGYGLVLFTYFVNRSADHILPYISLPALMTVTLWLAISLRGDWLSRRMRAAAAFSVVAAAALLVAVAWSNVGLRISQSALAYVPPGGKSLRAAVHRLWHPPPLAYGTADATQMLETYMPGEHESLVLASPDLTVEALMRTGRVNAVPLSDPWEDNLVASLHESDVDDAVAGLQPGRRMLIDRNSRAVLKDRGGTTGSFSHLGVVPLEAAAVRQVADRFRLERIARAPSGVEVVELRAR